MAQARSVPRCNAPRSRLRSLAREERGVAIVEFAIILPAFLLILLGVMDFGKVFNYWQSGTQAAAVGARAAAVDDWPGASTGTTLQEWILNQLRTKELHDDANVCVVFPDPVPAGGSNTSPGNRVTVRVRVPYGIPLVNALVHGASVNLRSSATMRIEVDSDPPTGTANAISSADDIGSCS